MRYLVVLLALMVANVAQAMDCRETPDCTRMGYSTASDPNCKDDGYIYCPFDQAYKKCVNMNCEALGFTADDKTSWCNKLIKCKGDTSFTLCQNLCEIGDVFYADGTCGYAQDYDASSGKIPVGVVYWVTDDGQHGKVINLHNLSRASSNANFDPANPYQTKTFQWGVYGTDIPDLTNWICSGSDNYLTVAKTGDHSHPFWSAGKEYTETIAKAQNNNLLYPASATLAFYPPDVPEDDPKVGKGKWYLPTFGELMDLYGYNYTSGLGNCSSSTGGTGATGTTKSKVNATLQALEDKGAGNAKTLTGDYYWSSSEYSSDYSWQLSMYNGARSYTSKDYYGSVRASLEF